MIYVTRMSMVKNYRLSELRNEKSMFSKVNLKLFKVKCLNQVGSFHREDFERDFGTGSHGKILKS